MGKNRQRVPGDEDGYYAERLAEPRLLDKAVLLDVSANETPFAVPVGKLRRGGHIEFLDRREAEKAVALLADREGFPNPRIIDHYSGKGKPADYWEVRWGDPPPFDGCDYVEPICGLLLGIHYGYSTEAIVGQFAHYLQFPSTYTKAKVLKIIKSARRAR